MQFHETNTCHSVIQNEDSRIKYFQLIARMALNRGKDYQVNSTWEIIENFFFFENQIFDNNELFLAKTYIGKNIFSK